MPVSTFHLPRIDRVDAEDFEGVKRLVKKELAKQGQVVSAEYLDAGVLALKQYYLVALLDPKNRHAVSDAIDPFWHAHILHTSQYMSFCDDVFQQYLPHVPLDHEDQDAVAVVARLYQHTANVYGDMFKHVDEHFYPRSVSTERLICYHSQVTTDSIRQHALFAPVALAA
jgi:hypothetical protein